MAHPPKRQAVWPNILLVTVSLVFTGEVLSRVKLYLDHGRDVMYLAAPLITRKIGPVEYRFDIDHFFEDERYLKRQGWTHWHRGEQWYYKLHPGTSPPPTGYHYAQLTINSMGFRGREFTPAKRPGVTRIFCIGESSTFGAESPDDATWPARLQQALDARHAGRFEVINAGFPGYASLNYLNLVRHELLRYEPDVFIIYAGVNDLNLNRNIERTQASGALRWLHTALYYRWSMLYTLLTEKASVLIHNSPVPAHIYRNTSREAFSERLGHILELAQANGIRVIVVRQIVNVDPALWWAEDRSLEQVRATAKQFERDHPDGRFASYLTVYRLNDLMQSLEGRCRDSGARMLDFRKEFRAAMEQGAQLFVDYVHLTAEANQLLAGLIAPQVDAPSDFRGSGE